MFLVSFCFMKLQPKNISAIKPDIAAFLFIAIVLYVILGGLFQGVKEGLAYNRSARLEDEKIERQRQSSTKVTEEEYSKDLAEKIHNLRMQLGRW